MLLYRCSPVTPPCVIYCCEDLMKGCRTAVVSAPVLAVGRYCSGVQRNGAIKPISTLRTRTLERGHCAEMAASFTDLRARNNDGEEVNFSIFEGKVVLAVNVARL